MLIVNCDGGVMKEETLRVFGLTV